MEGKSDVGDMIKMSRPVRDHRASKKRKIGLDRGAISDDAATEISEERSGHQRGRRPSRGGRGYGSRGRGGRGGVRGARHWKAGDEESFALSAAKRLKTEAGQSLVTPAVRVFTSRRPPGRPRRRVEAGATSVEEAAKRQDSGGAASSGSPAADNSTLRRALRPRPSVTKSVTKRNKPFKQVTLKPEDGARIVGRRLKVYWPLDSKWYYGEVKAFCPVTLRHRVVYDDKDEEWLVLQGEDFKLQVHDWEAVGETGALLAAPVKTPSSASGRKYRRRFNGDNTGDEGSLPSPSSIFKVDANPGDLLQSLDAASDGHLSLSDGEETASLSHAPVQSDSGESIHGHEDLATRIDSTDVTSNACLAGMEGLVTIGSLEMLKPSVNGGAGGPSTVASQSDGGPFEVSNGDHTEDLTSARGAELENLSTGKPKVVSVYTRRGSSAPKVLPPAPTPARLSQESRGELLSADETVPWFSCVDFSDEGGEKHVGHASAVTSEREVSEQVDDTVGVPVVDDTCVCRPDGPESMAAPDAIDSSQVEVFSEAVTVARGEGHAAAAGRDGGSRDESCIGWSETTVIAAESSMNSSSCLVDGGLEVEKSTLEVQACSRIGAEPHAELLSSASPAFHPNVATVLGGAPQLAGSPVLTCVEQDEYEDERTSQRAGEDQGSKYRKHFASRKRHFHPFMHYGDTSVSKRDAGLVMGLSSGGSHAGDFRFASDRNAKRARKLEPSSLDCASKGLLHHDMVGHDVRPVSPKVVQRMDYYPRRRSDMASDCGVQIEEINYLGQREIVASDCALLPGENHDLMQSRNIAADRGVQHQGIHEPAPRSDDMSSDCLVQYGESHALSSHHYFFDSSSACPAPNQTVINLPAANLHQGFRLVPSHDVIDSFLLAVKRLFGPRLPALQLQGDSWLRLGQPNCTHLQLQGPRGLLSDLEMCLRALQVAGMDLSLHPQISLSIEVQRNGAASTSQFSPFILHCLLDDAANVFSFSGRVIKADTACIAPSQWFTHNPVVSAAELQFSPLSSVHPSPQLEFAINGLRVKLSVDFLTFLVDRNTPTAPAQNYPVTVVNSVARNDSCLWLSSADSRNSLSALKGPCGPSTKWRNMKVLAESGAPEMVSLFDRANIELRQRLDENEWNITWNSWRLFRNASGNVPKSSFQVLGGHLVLPSSAVVDSEAQEMDGHSRDGASCSGRGKIYSVRLLADDEGLNDTLIGTCSLGDDRLPVGQQSAGVLKRTLDELEDKHKKLGRYATEDASLQESESANSVAVSKRFKHERSAARPVEVLPRFKLRRCPTNKEWGIARDSSGTVSKERLSDSILPKADGSFLEPAVKLVATTPQHGKKRLLTHSLDMSNETISESEATCSVCGLAAGACSHGDIQDGTVVKANRVGIEGIVAGASETRKRRRKGSSPISGDDLEGMSGKGRYTDSASPTVCSIQEDRNDFQSEPSFSRSANTSCERCEGNLLVMRDDRGWREFGLTVEILPNGNNTWVLAASLRGEALVTHKPTQLDATGRSNKYTHAMMFKVKKGLYLEFVTKKQWIRFKHLHEQCYQRNTNARTASARHIPIPGVKEIEEPPANATEESYVRPPLEYIRRRDREEDLSHTNRVIYDMDSEDELWLQQTNAERTNTRGSRSRPKISEDTFERAIGKLEKASVSLKNEVPTVDVAVEVCQGFGPPEILRPIYLYWLSKRQRKGMALIRQFQPAPCEQYEKQMAEWNQKFDQLQQQCPTASQKQLLAECKAPAQFAFCLRPKGLESSNKIQKQRSQRKQVKVGSSTRPWVSVSSINGCYLDSAAKHEDNHPQVPSAFSAAEKKIGRKMKRIKLVSAAGDARRRRLRNLQQVDQQMQHDSNGEVNLDHLLESDGHVTSPRGQHGAANACAYSLRRGLAGRCVEQETEMNTEATTVRMKLVPAAGDSRRRCLRNLQQVDPQMPHESQVQENLDQLFESDGQVGSAYSLRRGASGHVHSEQEAATDSEATVAMLRVAAKEAAEVAEILRTRAEVMYAQADASMDKAVQLVIEANCMQAAEMAANEALPQHWEADEPEYQPDSPQEFSGSLKFSVGFEASNIGQGKSMGQEPMKGPSFGSWRKGLENPARTSNSVGLRALSTRQSLVTDSSDDPLLPVASWSEELGAGLGTRLIVKGDASPQKACPCV